MILARATCCLRGFRLLCLGILVSLYSISSALTSSSKHFVISISYRFWADRLLSLSVTRISYNCWGFGAVIWWVFCPATAAWKVAGVKRSPTFFVCRPGTCSGVSLTDGLGWPPCVFPACSPVGGSSTSGVVLTVVGICPVVSVRGSMMFLGSWMQHRCPFHWLVWCHSASLSLVAFSTLTQFVFLLFFDFLCS